VLPLCNLTSSVFKSEIKNELRHLQKLAKTLSSANLHEEILEILNTISRY
jgi:tRNA A22 N-methylase